MSDNTDGKVRVIATKVGFDGIATRKPGDVFWIKKEHYHDGSNRPPSSWMKLADAPETVSPTESTIATTPKPEKKKLVRPKKDVI